MAIATPGLTPELKLHELKFWFVNNPGIIVSKYFLREDYEVALDEAIEELKEKFGKRRTTPEEMMEDLLTGDKIPTKSFEAVDDFVEKLEATHQLAMETGRGVEFNKRSLYENILKVKLPQFKYKWLQKWVKNEQERHDPLTFSDFIAYLNFSRKMSESVDRCDKIGTGDRSTPKPENGAPGSYAATSKNSNFFFSA